MILTLDERQVRFIDSVHLEKRPGHQGAVQLKLSLDVELVLEARLA